MTKAEYDNWIRDNATATERLCINDIHYTFATLKDGWIGVFEHLGSDIHPLIQAADRGQARSFCVMREPLNVPVTVL